MIAQIQGKIVRNGGVVAVVMTASGVAYEIKMSPQASKNALVGLEILVETYMVVREDAQELFGFASLAEKELFKNCISVSGIGPRTALHLLELGSVEEITLAIGRGDITYLTKVSGIGKKTAERLVVELKSKVMESGIGNQESGNEDSGVLGDVIDALITLGYSSTEARDAAKKLNPTGKSSEQLLREALQRVN